MSIPTSLKYLKKIIITFLIIEIILIKNKMLITNYITHDKTTF